MTWLSWLSDSIWVMHMIRPLADKRAIFMQGPRKHSWLNCSDCHASEMGWGPWIGLCNDMGRFPRICWTLHWPACLV